MFNTNVPNIIGIGNKVVCYTVSENKHVAICKPEGYNGYYLFYCDVNWTDFADTWHETVEDAKDQAEFDFDQIENWFYK